MANIIQAFDIHAAEHVDRSAGYPHIRHPLVELSVHIGLDPDEARLVRAYLSVGGSLQKLLGRPGVTWKLIEDIPALNARYNMKNLPAQLRDTTVLAREALEMVRQALMRLRRGR